MAFRLHDWVQLCFAWVAALPSFHFPRKEQCRQARSLRNPRKLKFGGVGHIWILQVSNARASLHTTTGGRCKVCNLWQPDNRPDTKRFTTLQMCAATHKLTVQHRTQARRLQGVQSAAQQAEDRPDNKQLAMLQTCAATHKLRSISPHHTDS